MTTAPIPVPFSASDESERRFPPALVARAKEILESVIRIGSESDASSSTIPSTSGQVELSAFLDGFFQERGFETRRDESANLLATLPGHPDAPALALMVHMDTAEGTAAPEALEQRSAWAGDRIPFPKNAGLEVDATMYPDAAFLVGHDVLFGPGNAPVGFDDKVGMAEMMLLAERLAGVPVQNRPTVHMVCRPDEEIGRMAAVEGLAKVLEQLQVRHGYTLDGFVPYEINTDNFNAAAAQVTLAPRPIQVPELALARTLTLRVQGVKSHGATAKAEGYLNATRIFVDVWAALSRRNDITPLYVETERNAETDAEIGVVVRAEDAQGLARLEHVVLGAFARRIEDRRRHGASVDVVGREDGMPPLHDAGMRALQFLATWARGAKVQPLWSEESEGFEGYAHPHAIHREPSGALRIDFRIRDFDKDALASRVADVVKAAGEVADASVTSTDQYVNMGDKMGACPELVTWAEAAGRAAGVPTSRRPIRGGTGVDPFLARGTFVANLGTGYFAPESEKELTSPQAIVGHTEWLLALLNIVAQSGSAK